MGRLGFHVLTDSYLLHWQRVQNLSALLKTMKHLANTKIEVANSTGKTARPSLGPGKPKRNFCNKGTTFRRSGGVPLLWSRTRKCRLPVPGVERQRHGEVVAALLEASGPSPQVITFGGIDGDPELRCC